MTSEKSSPPQCTPDPAPKPRSPSSPAGRFRWQGDFISLEGAIEAVRAAIEIDATDARWAIGLNEARLYPVPSTSEPAKLLRALTRDQKTIFLADQDKFKVAPATQSRRERRRADVLDQRRASFEQEEKLITLQRHRAAELLFLHLGSRGCDEIRWLELQEERLIPNPDLRRVGLGILAQLADHWSTSRPAGEKRLMPEMFDSKIRQAMEIGVSIDELLAYFEVNGIAYRLRPGAPLTSQSTAKLSSQGEGAEEQNLTSPTASATALSKSFVKAAGASGDTAQPAEVRTEKRQLSPTHFHDRACTLLDSGRMRAPYARAIGAAQDLCSLEDAFKLVTVWNKLFEVAANPKFSDALIRIAPDRETLEVPNLKSRAWKEYTKNALEQHLRDSKKLQNMGL